MMTVTEVQARSAAIEFLAVQVDESIDKLREALVKENNRSLAPYLDKVTLQWDGQDLLVESFVSKNPKSRLEKYSTFWSKGELKFVDGPVLKIAELVVGVKLSVV